MTSVRLAPVHETMFVEARSWIGTPYRNQAANWIEERE
jgi:hypothetical protein